MGFNFGGMFSRRSATTPVPSSSGRPYTGTFNLTAQLDVVAKGMLINRIEKVMREYLLSSQNNEVSRSMRVDLSRMDFYLDSKKVSVPGNENASFDNFMLAASQPGFEWMQGGIPAISSFFHQGLFVDLHASIPQWSSDNGEPWIINMVSLDNHSTVNEFHLFSSGVMKIISRAKVANVIIIGNKIVLTNRNKSNIEMQLTLRLAGGKGRRCWVTDPRNHADYAVARLECEGLM